MEHPKMQNPRSAGTGEGSQKDTYKGKFTLPSRPNQDRGMTFEQAFRAALARPLTLPVAGHHHPAVTPINWVLPGARMAVA